MVLARRLLKLPVRCRAARRSRAAVRSRAHLAAPRPPSALHAFLRRRVLALAALLLAAQLALFGHALTHDYASDADQPHAVCGLCLAAHQLDHGVAAARFALPPPSSYALALPTLTVGATPRRAAAFLARAPPPLPPV